MLKYLFIKSLSICQLYSFRPQEKNKNGHFLYNFLICRVFFVFSGIKYRQIHFHKKNQWYYVEPTQSLYITKLLTSAECLPLSKTLFLYVFVKTYFPFVIKLNCNSAFCTTVFSFTTFTHAHKWRWRWPAARKIYMDTHRYADSLCVGLEELIYQRIEEGLKRFMSPWAGLVSPASTPGLPSWFPFVLQKLSNKMDLDGC